MASGNRIQSLERSLDLLMHVAHSPQGLRLNEAARLCGLKPTTAYNMLRTLEAKGFLRKVENAIYKLGPAIPELTDRAAEDDLQDVVGKHMLNLARKYCSAVITFAERSGQEICCKLRKAPHFGGVTAPAKTQYTTLAGASARLLLSYSSEDCLKKYLLMNPEEDGREFKSAIKKIREEGLVVVERPDELLIAVAVSIATSQPVHALAIRITAQEGIEREEVLGDLRNAAKDIESEFNRKHKPSPLAL